MTPRDAITAVVYEAVDEVNEQLPRVQRLEKAPATPLLGPAARLDSLGLINLIAATQARLEASLGWRLTLLDGDLLAGGTVRLTTLAGLIDYIEAALATKNDG